MIEEWGQSESALEKEGVCVVLVVDEEEIIE